MTRIAVFAYGSLVAPESAELTLGRRPAPQPASLLRWRRRWSQVRDNLAVEKTFALPSSELPRWILGLNLEPANGRVPEPNGALLEVSELELERLATREIRYDPVEVTADVVEDHDFDRVLAYCAKPANFAPRPPEGAVVVGAYLRLVESAFERLGEEQLELFRRSTGAPPVDVVEAKLVRDSIPAGNPRDW